MKEVVHTADVNTDNAASALPAAQEEVGQFLQRLADDGHAWATEFCSRFPMVPFDDALGWFCNVIENTWDVRCSKLTRSAPAWDAFKQQVETHRRLWDEIDGATSASTLGPEGKGPGIAPNASSNASGQGG